MSQPSNLFLSIGKPVKDEYGRSIGRIISYATTPSGNFDAAYIELGDGRLTKQPMDNINFNGAEVTLLSKIKTKAGLLCDQIPFIWRKDQALKELQVKNKISPDLYRELHNNFSTVLGQLKKDAQTLQEEIEQGISCCEEELEAFSYCILHLELEHEIGKITDEIYRSSIAHLQENLKRTSAEKTDLEATKGKISNILLGDNSTVEQKAPQLAQDTQKDVKEAVMNEIESAAETQTIEEEEANITVSDESEPDVDDKTEAKDDDKPDSNDGTDLPEPPVVVYVKEVGKAGI